MLRSIAAALIQLEKPIDTATSAGKQSTFQKRRLFTALQRILSISTPENIDKFWSLAFR